MSCLKACLLLAACSEFQPAALQVASHAAAGWDAEEATNTPALPTTGKDATTAFHQDRESRALQTPARRTTKPLDREDPDGGQAAKTSWGRGEGRA